MSHADEAAWTAAVNAAGTTPARLQAAERLLASVEDEALSPELVDKLVTQAIAARATMAPRRRSSPAYRVIAAVALLATLAAVIPSLIWPEQVAPTRTLDCPGARFQAMTAADEPRRFEAIAALDEFAWQATKVLQQLAADPDPLLAANATLGLDRMLRSILGDPHADLACADFVGQQLIAQDPGRSAIERSLAAQQLAAWGTVAIDTMRTAVLCGAATSSQRDLWLQSLHTLLLTR